MSTFMILQAVGLVAVLVIFLLAIGFILLTFLAMIITEAKNKIPLLNTKTKLLEVVFEKIKLTNSSLVVDLGCGDGSVLRAFHSRYHCQCVGYENNFLLIWWNKFVAKILRLSGIIFEKQDIFTLKEQLKADVIYIFLLPVLVEKLCPNLLKYGKKGGLIVSHGFEVRGLEKKLIHHIELKPFGFYIYRL